MTYIYNLSQHAWQTSLVEYLVLARIFIENKVKLRILELIDSLVVSTSLKLKVMSDRCLRNNFVLVVDLQLGEGVSVDFVWKRGSHSHGYFDVVSFFHYSRRRLEKVIILISICNI